MFARGLLETSEETTHDIDALTKELGEAGGSFRGDIVAGKGGRQVLLEDPSGNLVELFEPAKT